MISSLLPEAPVFGGYNSPFTFSKQMQQTKDAKRTPGHRKRNSNAAIVFKALKGYRDYLHFTNFLGAIPMGKPVVEDATFDFQAATHALAYNASYLNKKIINCAPVGMSFLVYTPRANG